MVLKMAKTKTTLVLWSSQNQFAEKVIGPNKRAGGHYFYFLDFIAKVMDGTVQFDFMDKFHNKNDPAVS